MRAMLRATVLLVGLSLLACGKRRSAADAPDGPVTSAAGQPAIPKPSGACTLAESATLTDIEQIAAGETHACGVRRDGRVVCWGDNSSGQLGVAPNAPGGPVLVCGLSDAVEVSVTQYHSCARTKDGSVWCWGFNASGELGDGTTHASRTPVRVAGLGPAKGVSVASFHSCALEADGGVACWGMNTAAVLGTPSPDKRLTPARVPDLKDAVRVVTGSSSTCVLRRDATVACWGETRGGPLGYVRTAAPTPMAGASDVSSVSHGWYRGCAIRKNGSVACWGGDATPLGWSLGEPIPGVSDAVEVAVGLREACVRRRDGRVSCWVDRSEPQDVPQVRGATSIALGQAFGCARMPDASVKCWGADPETVLAERNRAEAERRKQWEAAGKLCPIDEIVVYGSPGCGKQAAHRCVKAIPPCADQFCGCDGREVGGCGVAVAPYRHAGPCRGDGGAPEL